MATISLTLHAHLPHVLRHHSVFDHSAHYFDAFRTREACRRLANRCILPVNRILLGLVRRTDGRFRFAFSLSGVAADLFERYAPEVLISFQALAETGCAEPLGMPYDNSLALLYSRPALSEQVRMQRARMTALCRVEPVVFCNSALIYGDELADAVGALGFSGIICDGLYETLAARSCNRVYASASGDVPLLLRNERLTRDVSERFIDRGWDQWPLTAPRFADRLAQFASADEVVNLVWDYTTFGMGVPADAGIFDFLRYFPEKVLVQDGLTFATPSEVLAAHQPADTYQPGRIVSTAERLANLSAWLGNPMQSHALHRLFALEPAVRAVPGDAVRADWCRLQACEYFEAMATAGTPSTGAAWSVAAASPYDAYINYMNLCDNLAERCGVVSPV